ncbi:hypothetical protein NMY22_g1786 [Coprinellus aureogranulatus]|nr:hypothetical protein NMY22_g1786 [Coprinellus aureogranulatus]
MSLDEAAWRSQRNHGGEPRIELTGVVDTSKLSSSSGTVNSGVEQQNQQTGVSQNVYQVLHEHRRGDGLGGEGISGDVGLPEVLEELPAQLEDTPAIPAPAAAGIPPPPPMQAPPEPNLAGLGASSRVELSAFHHHVKEDDLDRSIPPQCPSKQ